MKTTLKNNNNMETEDKEFILKQFEKLKNNLEEVDGSVLILKHIQKNIGRRCTIRDNNSLHYIVSSGMKAHTCAASIMGYIIELEKEIEELKTKNQK